MMKALIALSMLALVGATVVAPTAVAYGFCAGMCTEVTYTKTNTTTMVETDIQTCAGNVIVQVGVSNDAELCNEGDDDGEYTA